MLKQKYKSKIILPRDILFAKSAKYFGYSESSQYWSQLHSISDVITVSFLMPRRNFLRLLCKGSWNWLSRAAPTSFFDADCTVYLLILCLSFFCSLIERNWITWLFLFKRWLLWAHASRHWHFPVFCLLWESPLKLEYLIIFMLWDKVCQKR